MLLLLCVFSAKLAHALITTTVAKQQLTLVDAEGVANAKVNLQSCLPIFELEQRNFCVPDEQNVVKVLLEHGV